MKDNNKTFADLCKERKEEISLNIRVLKRIGFSAKDILMLLEGEAKLADMLPQRLSSLQEEIPRIQNAIECIDRLMHRDPDDDNWKWCAKKMGIVV